MLTLALAAAALGLGAVFGWSWRARWLLVAILYVGVLMVQTAAPGSAAARALGGSFRDWAALGLVVLAVMGYRVWLGRVRARAAPDPGPAAPDRAARELARNARHIVLREIGGPGQRRIGEARVLVVGAGGLGSPAVQYLAAAGVGTLGVIDDDVVEISNLARQVIHTEARTGQPKVFSAAEAVAAQAPGVDFRPYNRRLVPGIAETLIADYDLVLDGCDDPATRYAVNAAAVARGVPLVSGALSQWEGQISVFDPARGAPCYACVFPQAPAPGLAPSCAEGGVLGPLPGVIGAMMAVEAIKLIAGAGRPLRGRMVIYDALWGESREMRLSRRPGCPVCGGGTG